MERDVTTDIDEAPGFRVWRGQPYTSMPPNWHDQVEINYCADGEMTYLFADSVVSVAPGRLSMFWAGMPHSVIEGPETESFYWVYMPLLWMLRLGLPGSFMRSVMGGEMVVDAAPLETDRPMLDRWCDELPQASDACKRLVVREVEARVMRFALSQTEGPGQEHSPQTEAPVRKVSEMARFIAENHTRQLQARDIAGHVGLHPNYAMTLFQRYYGMTLNGYLTRMRVCQAQYLLLSTEREISSIALETGFGSLSRFYEAFKTVSGDTPRQYRILPKLS